MDRETVIRVTDRETRCYLVEVTVTRRENDTTLHVVDHGERDSLAVVLDEKARLALLEALR